MSCAMIYWGNNYTRFYEIFIEFGAVIDIESLQNKKIGEIRKMMTLDFDKNKYPTSERLKSNYQPHLRNGF